MVKRKVDVVLTEEPKTESKTESKKSSKWVEHVKEYSKQNNMTYGQCLKDEKCKSSYKK